ncbi:hypothetical protein EVAR_98085_1 [Eumeta japonica]|uniref:Uncharacterized protein n=1 Tax=Eumeta variegata TaxID=151549 RepID=A0A4C1WCU1_EUMVA|nr:hypothetical protein EVAR_98085_1 [Eumeta japonica]
MRVSSRYFPSPLKRLIASISIRACAKKESAVRACVSCGETGRRVAIQKFKRFEIGHRVCGTNMRLSNRMTGERPRDVKRIFECHFLTSAFGSAAHARMPRRHGGKRRAAAWRRSYHLDVSPSAIKLT